MVRKDDTIECVICGEKLTPLPEQDAYECKYCKEFLPALLVAGVETSQEYSEAVDEQTEFSESNNVC